MKRFTRVFGPMAMVFMVLGLAFSALMPGGGQRAAAQDDWYPPQTVYIPETGQTLDRAFLDMWRGAGGVNTFGYPITAEITQPNGHVVQYFQYARFEYWPEGDANGNTILLGKLGEELRPAQLQRSGGGAAITGATGAQMKAWLPVSADSDHAKSEGVVYVDATQHTLFGAFLDYWYATGDASFLGNPLTEEYTIGDNIYQVFERGQLRYNDTDGVSLMPIGESLVKKYNLDTSATGQGDIPTYDEALFIPPPEPTAVPTEESIAETSAMVDSGVSAPTDGVWIDVNISTQYAVIYQGQTVLTETYVSTGRPGFDTPTGTFYVNSMLDSQTMEGVLGGEYYNVPDVPYVMYFTGEGHAIHGTYWHSNFGAVMSHGCVNLPMDVAAYLYSIAYIGMPVVIHY